MPYWSAMGIPMIFLLSAGAAALAVVGFLIFHRLVKPIDLNEHQGFLDAMLNIVGTLVSIVLGLLVAAALDRYHTLEQSVDKEAADVSQVYRLARGLPGESQDRMLSFCKTYCHDVVDQEWPDMALGKPNYITLLTYSEAMGWMATFKPANDGESNVQAAIINSLLEIGDCRRMRLLSLDNYWTRHLLPVLLMCAVIVFAFAFLYMRRGATLHAVVICLVAAAMGGNLGLIVLLDNPFRGDWMIQPKGFIFNLKLLDELPKSPSYRKILESHLKARETAPSSLPAK
jgi:hypothetical protein